MASFSQRDIEQQLQAQRDPTGELLLQLKREKSYVVSEEYTNASTGETANLYLENPTGSGVTAMVKRPVGNPAALSYVRVYDAFSDDPAGSGTAVDAENNLLDKGGEGGTDSGQINAETGVTFSATNTFYARLVGGGVGSRSIADAGASARFAIEPGRRVVIEVEKLESGQDYVAISTEWYTVPVVLTEENIDPDNGDVFPT